MHSARTVARLRALDLAAQLGLTLTKPALRRATDRLERVFKADVSGLVEVVKARIPEPPAASAPEAASTSDTVSVHDAPLPPSLLDRLDDRLTRFERLLDSLARY